jgi:hypothetical protein
MLLVGRDPSVTRIDRSAMDSQPQALTRRLFLAGTAAGTAGLLVERIPGAWATRYLRRRGIRPRIARRMVDSSARLGRHRWTIERTGAWLGGFRRLRIRYERSAERFYALAMLACSLICFNALQQPPR